MPPIESILLLLGQELNFDFTGSDGGLMALFDESDEEYVPTTMTMISSTTTTTPIATVTAPVTTIATVTATMTGIQGGPYVLAR